MPSRDDEPSFRMHRGARARRVRGVQRLFLSFAAALVAAGCSPPPPRAPLPTQPLDEARAISLIAQALRDAGAAPAAGRDVQLVTGRRVHMEVTAAGHAWGVAFITAAEQAELVPNKDYVQPVGNDIPVVQGFGPDADVAACLLFARDYTWEVATDEERSQHNIAAERRLQRDVRDFVVQAGAHHFK